MYIEDTLSQRLLVTEMLILRGLKVDGFSSGEKAFAAFEEKDTGAGLSSEACQEMFKKFNRLDTEKISIEGTGLELYVTKKIVNEINADIEVKSKLGMGTQFSIKLPIKK